MANRSQMIAPAKGAAALTPSNDSGDNVAEFNAIWVGVSGDVSVVFPGASSGVVLTNVPVGVLPVRGVRVAATGTTASELVALRS